MDAIFPVLIGGGIGLLGWASWYLARRFGLWPGLILPVLATALATLRSRMPLGHAEEAMGRGIEIAFVWGPLILLTVVGALVGLAMRRRG
jgi:hypothetical protein